VNDNFEPKTAVYTPQQVSAYGIQAIELMREKKSRSVGLPIPLIRDYFANMISGQICAVQAQTSNGKTLFLQMWQDMLAQQLMDEGREEEIIISVSVEESIEEQAFTELARHSGENAGDLARGDVQDWSKLNKAAVMVGTIPIYRIGDSLARADDMPLLYLSNIYRSMKYMVDELLGRRLGVAAVFVDYIQALPIDPEIKSAVRDQQRRLQVRSDVYRLRQMGRYFDCPVIFGCQAKQNMQGAPGPNMLIPGNYDGEETSAIGQRADRIISLWMPKQTHTIGSTLDHKNISFAVREDMLWVKVGKQRGGYPAGRSWMCNVDYHTNTIEPDPNFHRLEYEERKQPSYNGNGYRDFAK